MTIIENIHIETFRGIKELKLEDLAQINILTGKNNSGKTSVLEVLKNFRNFMDWDHQNMLAGNEEILYTNVYLEEFQELFDIDSEEKIITYEVGLKSKNLNVSIKAADENTWAHAEIRNLLKTRIPIVSDRDRFLEFDRNLKKIFECPDLYKETVEVLKEYDDDIIGFEYRQEEQPGPNYGHYTWTITKSSGKHFPLQARQHNSGPDAEMGRIVISLMQCLDNLVHGQIVIAATNREDILDKALKRRFRNKVEFTKFNENEELKMIEKFVESIDLMEMDQELIEYTKGNHTQSETMDFLVEKLIQKVSKEVI